MQSQEYLELRKELDEQVYPVMKQLLGGINALLELHQTTLKIAQMSGHKQAVEVRELIERIVGQLEGMTEELKSHASLLNVEDLNYRLTVLENERPLPEVS